MMCLWQVETRAFRPVVCLVLAVTLGTASAASFETLPNPDWVTIKDASLEIAAGSPLDFSSYVEEGPAGRHGRLVETADHQFAFINQPNVAVRFYCAAASAGFDGATLPTHQRADEYALQLRRHGYNAVRFQYMDIRLMKGRTHDFDYDPVLLDHFQYFLSALKRNGIYWIIDAITSPNGGSAEAGKDIWQDHEDLLYRLYYDAAARVHWTRLVETLLGAVNPYTKIRPLDDPALAILTLANEGSIGFLADLRETSGKKPFPDALQPLFNGWLREKYGSTKKLAQSWSDLQATEELESGTVRMPDSNQERSPRLQDAILFFLHLEHQTYEALDAIVRKLGYRGLTTGYDNHPRMAENLARRNVQVVDMHSYHDGVGTYALGASIEQTSSLSDKFYMYGLAGARWLDKPFIVTEYGQGFWNRYRFEAGIGVPALASLQGWNLISRHADTSVELSFSSADGHPKSIRPYSVGLDPIARAGETLAFFLYARGDVQPAKATIGVPFDARAVKDAGVIGNMPFDSEIMALLTRYGLIPPSKTGSVSLTMPLVPESPSGWSKKAHTGWKTLDAWLGDPEKRNKSRLFELRRRGILSASNRTNVDKGIYEAATGELLYDVKKGQMEVRTSKTQAMSFVGLTGPVDMGALHIEHASGAGLLAVSALDDVPITRSRKLLIIYATDARNSNMTFADSEERIISDYGAPPILMRREAIEIRLDLEPFKSAHLYALHLNGEMGDEVELKQTGTQLSMTLALGTHAQGPTTFYLLSLDR